MGKMMYQVFLQFSREVKNYDEADDIVKNARIYDSLEEATGITCQEDYEDYISHGWIRFEHGCTNFYVEESCQIEMCKIDVPETFKNIRKKSGLTQNEFSLKYKIPIRTIENWEGKKRNPPSYLLYLLERVVDEDTRLTDAENR